MLHYHISSFCKYKMSANKAITSNVNFDTDDERVEVETLVSDFSDVCMPVEQLHLLLLEDKRTHAKYIECHVSANKLVELATVDVPIDPDEQAEYRANREIVEDHVAFERMKEDAIGHRTFSNIVAEFTRSFDESHPIKIIGGQHRFTAVQQALGAGVNEIHGLKVYFGLSNDQRIDVQLISNTNIAASTDLFDRMQETLAGPNLRDWCQKVGLLADKQDFADRRARSDPITVRAARTFIVNYFRGKKVKDTSFESEETTPSISKSGVDDPEWKSLKKDNSALWTDPGLLAAGKEFSLMIHAQRAAFAANSPKKKAKANQGDFAEKALNFAVLSAWAFVAGVLSTNSA